MHVEPCAALKENLHDIFPPSNEESDREALCAE
jgi:hypothetical protein